MTNTICIGNTTLGTFKAAAVRELLKDAQSTNKNVYVRGNGFQEFRVINAEQTRGVCIIRGINGQRLMVQTDLPYCFDIR